MLFTKNNCAKNALAVVARREGISKQQVEKDIQEIIDIAWKTQDPRAKQKQETLFGKQKPSVEDFILRLALEV